MAAITDMFGVHIDAENSFVQAAVYGFLFVGIASFAAPVFSAVRLLLSLFVLPGKSVCGTPTPQSRQEKLDWPGEEIILTLQTSSAPLDLAAPGRS